MSDNGLAFGWALLSGFIFPKMLKIIFFNSALGGWAPYMQFYRVHGQWGEGGRGSGEGGGAES